MNTNFDTDNEDYNEKLISRIKYILSKSNKKLSFYELVTQVEGANPISVKTILDKLSVDYTFDNLAYSLPQSFHSKTNKNKRILSDPHPADFDWRFNEETIKKYTQYLLKFANKKIALLGIKTIFIELRNRRIDTTLFNSSISLLNDFKTSGYHDGLVESDLFDLHPNYNNIFDLVIADPPWYPEHYNAFINRSAEFLRINGILHLSVLKKLTRPQAEKDIENILLYAHQAGLKFIKKIPNYFTYETPTFEQNTLRTHKIYCENWRKSDLFIFQKVIPLDNQNVLIEKTNQESWLEFKWQDKKIKIRKNRIENDSHFFYENADPDSIIFTNVSRRSPYRDRIDIWTSDNLAFRVYRIQVIVSYFEYIETGMVHNEAMAVVESQFSLTEGEIFNLNKLLEIIFNDNQYSIF